MIFEIPGVYYYLSLSEDAFNTLHLGSAMGKNEIDSTLDHIVRIPPVTGQVGTDIAEDYCKQSLPERVYRMISTVSYGIPRDIIRLCDRVLAEDDFKSIKPKKISDDQRKWHAKLAYEEHLLSKNDYLKFGPNKDVHNAINSILQFFKNEERDRSSDRVVLSLLLLSFISVAVLELNEETWITLSEKLSAIGYEIPNGNTETLKSDLTALFDV